MRRKWTEEECNFIKENFCTMSYSEISIKLNRTIAAIACKIDHLKLERPLIFTEYEDKYIIKNHGVITNKEIATNLQITISSLERRIAHLNLSRDNKYSKEEDAFIRANYTSMSYADIAKCIGRTSRAIDSRCNVLGLTKRPRKCYTKEDIQRIIDAKSISERLSLAKEFDVSYKSICLTRRRRTGENCKLCNKFGSMFNRCFNQNNKDYKSYGGRGIAICKEWLNDDRKFVEWAINNGYEEHLTIERIDVNGNYCPQNCTWITMNEQANNKRNSVFITAFEETKTIAQWSEDPRCTVSRSSLKSRFKSEFLQSFTPEEILTLSRSELSQRKKQNVQLQP
jgi:hypothetical protein